MMAAAHWHGDFRTYWAIEREWTGSRPRRFKAPPPLPLVMSKATARQDRMIAHFDGAGEGWGDAWGNTPAPQCHDSGVDLLDHIGGVVARGLGLDVGTGPDAGGGDRQS